MSQKKTQDEKPQAPAATTPAPAVPPATEPTPAPSAPPAELTEKEKKAAAAAQKADELALKGKLTPTQRAMVAFGLEEKHILKSAEYPQEDGSVNVVILTHGGRRVRWPEDEGRVVLSPMDKGEGGPVENPAGIFPAKK